MAASPPDRQNTAAKPSGRQISDICTLLKNSAKFRQFVFRECPILSLRPPDRPGPEPKSHHALFYTYTLETLGEFDRIDRVDHVKKLDGLARLVRLQMADQMPFGSVAADLRRSCLPPPAPCSRRKRCSPAAIASRTDLGRMRLAHGDQFYVIRRRGRTRAAASSYPARRTSARFVTLEIARHTVKYTKSGRPILSFQC